MKANFALAPGKVSACATATTGGEARVRLAPGKVRTDAGARGFVGVAFRIDESGGSFSCEGLYIRPANGRADDQVRRNHSTQYFSYPGWDFDRLRREAPAKYEAYADLVPGEWTHLRIEVAGATARLSVGNTAQPTLIVSDLKRGADARGTVGLFVDNGTDGHFRNLSIRSQ